MSIARRATRTLLFLVLAGFALSGLRQSLAASNTGTGLTGTAGSSSGVVSGYDISATDYVPNASNSLNTDAIVITYSGSPTPNRIRLSPTGASATFYYTEAASPAGNQCTATATTITCNTTSAGGGHQGTYAEVTNLTLVLGP